MPIVYAETRQLAEEWTYRYLAAAHAWASTELAAVDRIGVTMTAAPTAADATEPTTSEVRTWTRAAGLTVADRGRLSHDVHPAWHDANPGMTNQPGSASVTGRRA